MREDRGLRPGFSGRQGNLCSRLLSLTKLKGDVAMKTAQRFLNPVIVVFLGWVAFFGGVLIEAPAISLPLEAIARVLP